MERHEFGNKIRMRREELGLSQQDLAIALNVDQGKVSLIEKGARRIDMHTELPALARVLRCSIGWFFDETDEDSLTNQFIKQYFPDVKFTELELKRLENIMGSLVKSVVSTDPTMGEKVEHARKDKQLYASR